MSAARDPRVWAAGAFVVLFPLILWTAFRLLRGRLAASSEGTARGALVWTLARLVLVAAAVFALPALAWAWRERESPPGRLLAGIELFLVFGVLAAGLSMASIRLGLRLSPRAGPGAWMASRALPWLAGSGYAAATAWYSPGGAGATLFAVFLLGVALAAVGLNRAEALDADELRRVTGPSRR
jgi:hypothetical protein